MAYRQPTLRPRLVDLDPVTKMPADVLVEILGDLPDLDSLRNACQAHRLFYKAFKCREASVLADVLKHQIPTAILQFALAVHDSSPESPRRPNDSDGIREFLANLYGSRKICHPHSHLRFRDARRLLEVHEEVDLLMCFCAEMLQGDCFLDGPEPWTGATSDALATAGEKFRYLRALYRIQLFYNLFRHCAVPYEEQAVIFFNHHSPWVNEQIYCVAQQLVDLWYNSNHSQVSRFVV